MYVAICKEDNTFLTMKPFNSIEDAIEHSKDFIRDTLTEWDNTYGEEKEVVIYKLTSPKRIIGQGTINFETLDG